MKIKELEKIYSYDKKSNSFIIPVQLEDYLDAYSDWDFSPFINRDLDDNLIEYLNECSEEIPLKYGLIINFYILNIKQNKIREDRSILGMRNYFLYQLRRLKNQQLSIIKDMITYFIIGIILLIFSYNINGLFSNSIVLTILAEGFSIGGWVMFWEMFESWFFRRNSVRKSIKQYDRFENAKITYSYKKEL